MRSRADKSVPVPTNIGPGTVLSKRFRLVKPIGSGGMAIVWRAEHLVLGIPVALKMLRPVDAHSKVARARFEKEARTVAALTHPNVVHILEYGMHGDVPFFAMELLEGETLARRLQRLKTLDATTVVWLVEQIARPVDKAHAKGIIHRDIKPDNIFLHATEEGEVPKLVDFGIAKLIDGDAKDSLTRTDAVIGTTHYLSPERARGKKPIDAKVDLWALAVVVYECMVGQRPFDEYAEDLLGLLKAIAEVDYPPPSVLRPIPPEFDAWTDQALNPNPNRRFGSAAEMAAALREALLPGTVSSLTGMAFEALEAEMRPSRVDLEQEAITNEGDRPDDAPLPSVDDLPRLLEPSDEASWRRDAEAFKSQPQLRRFDLWVEPRSVEVEPAMNPTACAELETAPPTLHDVYLEPTRTNRVSEDTDEPTRVMEDVVIPAGTEDSVETATAPMPSQSATPEMPISRPVDGVRPPVASLPQTSVRDWRVYALAAVTMIVAAGLGGSAVWLVGPWLQGSSVSAPRPDASEVSLAQPASVQAPIVASALPPAISVAPPVWDVERLPVPDSDSSSPAPTQTLPPGRRNARPVGTGRKPHEVFGL
jgi:serine/threonine-protein kinase